MAEDSTEHLGSSDGSSAFNVLSRLIDAGCDLFKESGKCWIFDWSGQRLIEARTIEDMREQLEQFDIDAHELRWNKRVRWYMENRNRLLGRS